MIINNNQVPTIYNCEMRKFYIIKCIVFINSFYSSSVVNDGAKYQLSEPFKENFIVFFFLVEILDLFDILHFVLRLHPAFLEIENSL